MKSKVLVANALTLFSFVMPMRFIGKADDKSNLFTKGVCQHEAIEIATADTPSFNFIFLDDSADVNYALKKRDSAVSLNLINLGDNYNAGVQKGRGNNE